MSNVAICFLTYKRTCYAVPALKSILQNLRCSSPLYLHIADNDSPCGHVDQLLTIAREYPLEDITISVASGGGYGHNYNVATQTIHEYADIVLPVEDDWILRMPLSLDVYVSALQTRDACIRLGNIGVVGSIRATLVDVQGRCYWELDPDSPDQYIFSGNPRIETRAWERAVGPWPVGLTAGETELSVGSRHNARTNVLWPVGLEPFGIFGHIGADKA